MKQTRISKILNVSIRESTYINIIKKCNQLSVSKSRYVRELLYDGFGYSGKKDMYIQLSGDKNKDNKMAEKYVTIRVSEEIYQRLKEISTTSGVSLPRIAGHFVEKGFEREEKQK